MAGKSEIQKMIDGIDEQIKTHKGEIETLLGTRKWMEDKEKLRKKAADEKKKAKEGVRIA